ncbi:MAG: AI-2E family transporter [Propionicimonas sp.]
MTSDLTSAGSDQPRAAEAPSGDAADVNHASDLPPAPDGSMAPPASVAPAPRRIDVDLTRPFARGLVAGLGLLVAVGLGAATVSLSHVWVYIGISLFIAMALNPILDYLQRKGMSKTAAMILVFVLLGLVAAAVVSIVVPMIFGQITQLAGSIPAWIADLQTAEWYQNLVALSGGQAPVDAWLDQLIVFFSNPANLIAIAGGAFAVGVRVVDAITGSMFILIITLYFTATLRQMEDAATLLAPAYARTKVRSVIDHIATSVGLYLGGMFILAVCNAAFAFILLTVLGVPYAVLLAAIAVVITMIPMVGPVTFWLIASTVLLLDGGWPLALPFILVYFGYLQVEAYIMTPKVMSKQVELPGSVVIISALIGGSLLGLLGALLSVPVAATLMMIIGKIFVPRQDTRTIAPHGSAFG